MLWRTLVTVLRRILLNLVDDDDPAVRLERVKMLANALQVIALGIFLAAVIAPMFNSALKLSFFSRIAGAVAAGAIEAVALHVVGYISPEKPKEDIEQ